MGNGSRRSLIWSKDRLLPWEVVSQSFSVSNCVVVHVLDRTEVLDLAESVASRVGLLVVERSYFFLEV